MPSDLRSLIVAIRSVASDVFPGVHLDTIPSLEATPVAPHQALTIVSRYEYAPRTLQLGPDGSVLKRSRTSAGLYPVGDCPAREFSAPDPATLVKLHALETPSHVIFAGTSYETQALFSSVMSDCPAVNYGYTSPDVRVPTDVRWILFYVRAPPRLPAPEPSRSMWVDSVGRFHAQRDKQAVNGTFDDGAAPVGELDRAVRAAHEASWAPGYPLGVADCLDSFYVIRIDRAGQRRAGNSIDLPCDGARAPADAHAIAMAANALLSRIIR